MQHVFRNNRLPLFLHQPLIRTSLSVFFLWTVLPVHIAQSVETNITSTTDSGSLNTSINPNGNDFEIRGGERHGGNLFHGFQDFSLGAGDTAKFLNNSGANISNILSRVTGGNVSEIDGTIDTMDFPNANFFFLNPAGVTFGTEATLNVDGSFHVSTADYLKLKDNTRFYADPTNQTGVLSVAAPAAFGFLETENGRITGSGHLKVPEGKSVSFIASAENSINVLFEEGIIDALGGNITLAQVSTDSEVPISESSTNVSSTKLTNLDIPAEPIDQEIFIRGGKLTVSGGAVIGNPEVKDISIHVEKLNVMNGGRLTTETFNPEAGNISIDAENSVIILTESVASFKSDINTSAIFGLAGNIKITSPKVVIKGDASITSTSGGISDSTSKIELFVDTLELTDRAKIATLAFFFSNVKAGTIKIDAKESVSVSNQAQINSATTGFKGAGSIIIDSPVLNVSNGLITSESTADGNGGDINIINAETITLDNQTQVTTKTTRLGKGGTIDINTKQLTLKNGSTISAESEGTDLNITELPDQGKSGDIFITATDFLQLQDNSSISVKTNEANAGLIQLIVGNILNLRQSSKINSSVTNEAGNGGDIFIDPIFVILDKNSKIEADTAEGQGGQIKIVTDFFLGFRNNVTANANGPGGINGTVNINAPEANIISGILLLPENFTDMTPLLSQPCTNQTSHLSSLTVANSNGIPISPDTLMSSDITDLENGNFSSYEQINRSVTSSKKATTNNILANAQRKACNPH